MQRSGMSNNRPVAVYGRPDRRLEADRRVRPVRHRREIHAEDVDPSRRSNNDYFDEIAESADGDWQSEVPRKLSLLLWK